MQHETARPRQLVDVLEAVELVEGVLGGAVVRDEVERFPELVGLIERQVQVVAKRAVMSVEVNRDIFGHPERAVEIARRRDQIGRDLGEEFADSLARTVRIGREGLAAELENRLPAGEKTLYLHLSHQTQSLDPNAHRGDHHCRCACRRVTHASGGP